MFYLRPRHTMRQNCCDTSPRQVVATNRLVWHVKIIVAATEFCPCDLSCDVSQRENERKQPCRTACTHLWQNLNQPMRKHQLVSRHVKFELVYISSLPKIDYVHRTRVLTQRLVAGSVQTRRLVAAMCRSDLSHRVSRLLSNRALFPCFHSLI